MTKKLFCLLLALVMTACVFSGCGSSENDVQTNTNEVVTASASAEVYVQP